MNSISCVTELSAFFQNDIYILEIQSKYFIRFDLVKCNFGFNTNDLLDHFSEVSTNAL